MYKKYISVLASMALVSAGAMAQNDSIKKQPVAFAACRHRERQGVLSR